MPRTFPARATRSVRPKWRVLLPLAVIAMLLFLIPWLRAYLALDRLQRDARALQALGADKLLSPSSGEADALVARAVGDFRDIRGSLGPLVYLLPALRWMPGYGGDLANAPALLEFGDQAIGAAQDTLVLGRAIVADMDADHSSQANAGATLLVTAQSQTAQVSSLRRKLVKVAEARRAIDGIRLSPAMRSAMDRVDLWLPLWQSGIQLLESAPALLGIDRQRHYLLIAQNSDELRATGGFISGVALLRVDRGQISVGEFQDSFAVDDLSKRHPEAPEPLIRYMFAWQWLFRDANWSPDLPTSARQLVRMYELDRGIKVDGVIAVNLNALPAILEAVGPISTAAGEEPVSGTNVVAKIKEYWTSPLVPATPADWWYHRKDYVGDLLKAVMGRLMSGEFNRSRAVESIAELARTKDLWVYVEGSDGAASLVVPQDGTLYHGTGDALMLVDSNVGFNKVDSNMQRSIDYTVQVEPSGSVRGTVVITYTNKSTASDAYCVHQPLYLGTYVDLQQGCYWNYVRVVVPPGSELLLAGGVTDAKTDTTEAGRIVFGGYLVIPRGATRQVRFTYRLPFLLESQSDYTVKLEKQPGVPAIETRVRMLVPEGWEVGSSAGQVLGDGVQVTLLLDNGRTVGFSLARRIPAFVPVVVAGVLLVLSVGMLVGRRMRFMRDA